MSSKDLLNVNPASSPDGSRENSVSDDPNIDKAKRRGRRKSLKKWSSRSNLNQDLEFSSGPVAIDVDRARRRRARSKKKRRDKEKALQGDAEASGSGRNRSKSMSSTWSKDSVLKGTKSSVAKKKKKILPKREKGVGSDDDGTTKARSSTKQKSAGSEMYQTFSAGQMQAALLTRSASAKSAKGSGMRRRASIAASIFLAGEEEEKDPEEKERIRIAAEKAKARVRARRQKEIEEKKDQITLDAERLERDRINKERIMKAQQDALQKCLLIKESKERKAAMMKEREKAERSIPVIYTSEVTGDRGSKRDTEQIKFILYASDLPYRVKDISLDVDAKLFMYNSSNTRNYPQLYVNNVFKGVCFCLFVCLFVCIV